MSMVNGALSKARWLGFLPGPSSLEMRMRPSSSCWEGLSHPTVQGRRWGKVRVTFCFHSFLRLRQL